MRFVIISYMRNKRLIILLSVLGGIVVLIVVMSAVFTVYNIEARCVSDYSPTQEAEIGRTSDDVEAAAADFMYRSIFLFDEDELAETVNSKVIRAEVTDVVCVFPNKVKIEYAYVDDRVQIFDEASGRYIIAGASGKITTTSDNDMSETQDSEVIAVIPSSAPDSVVPGTYLYGEESFDGMALDVFIDYAESLEPSGGGGKAFRAAYRSLDLSEALTSGMTGGAKISVVMRSGFVFDINGSVLDKDFTFADRETLMSAVRAMVSFYSDAGNSDAINDSDGRAVVQYVNGEFKVAFAA